MMKIAKEFFKIISENCGFDEKGLNKREVPFIFENLIHNGALKSFLLLSASETMEEL